jgi:hypothetical protein
LKKELYGLDEEVYVEQPQGYEIRGQEKEVYRLKKAMYRFLPY